jgi:hypothetical protein
VLAFYKPKSSVILYSDYGVLLFSYATHVVQVTGLVIVITLQCRETIALEESPDRLGRKITVMIRSTTVVNHGRHYPLIDSKILEIDPKIFRDALLIAKGSSIQEKIDDLKKDYRQIDKE